MRENSAGQPASGGSFRVVVSREEGTCPAYSWPKTLFEIPVTVGVPRVRARLDMPTPVPGVPVYRYELVTGLECDEETVDREVHDAPLLPAYNRPQRTREGLKTCAFWSPMTTASPRRG